MKHLLFSALLMVLTAIQMQAQTQKKYILSGSIRDANTGETLVSAVVEITGATNASNVSNGYGFFTLSAVEGSNTLKISHPSYETKSLEILVKEDLNMNIALTPKGKSNDVIVTSKKRTEPVPKAIMGADKLNMTEMNKMPVLFGERDILKTVQLMPGYKPAGEGNSGINVRGGGTDQNLILLDEAPVYNASHLLGFFSTFNSDAVKDVTAYKGGMPAQYGGRLSSVFDIKMKDGNQKKLDLEGGIGIIASRLKISAPIVKNKGSFIISARRTYADAFLKLQKDSALKQNVLYFYDLNLKANYNIGKKDRVYLSGYFGRDILGLGKDLKTDWGNQTGTFRWNHIFGKKLFSNTSIIYSKFDYQIKVTSGTSKYKALSAIEDVNYKQDFEWNKDNKNKIRFGANIINHQIKPGSVKAESATAGVALQTQKRYSVESAVYASHEWKPTKDFEMILGIRASNFLVKGPGKFNTYNFAGAVTSTKNYAKGKKVTSYFNIEPRFSMSYKLNSVNTIKASYNRNVQNLHLISNATASSPTDVWLPSSNNIKPEIADQVALGWYNNPTNGNYEFTSEVYYKDLKNQIDYRNAAVTLGNDNVESELLYGTGRAYGLEMMMRKKTGRLTGWVAYTISKVEKKINGINDGKYFNARQDRTHDIAIVAMYDLNKKWSLSSNWVYTTGNAVTYPTGKYEVNGQTVYLYNGRNTERFPAYHRLDIAATYEPAKNKVRRFQSSWTFGLYNAYSRQNAYSINFRENKYDPNKSEAVRTSLFKIIPSVTWNFKF